MKETAELSSVHNIKNKIIKRMFAETDSVAHIARKHIV